MFLLAFLSHQRLLNVPALLGGSSPKTRALRPVHVALVVGNNLFFGYRNCWCLDRRLNQLRSRCDIRVVVRENTETVEDEVDGTDFNDHATEKYAIIGR